jgi:hypothetical protein
MVQRVDATVQLTLYIHPAYASRRRERLVKHRMSAFLVIVLLSVLPGNACAIQLPRSNSTTKHVELLENTVISTKIAMAQDLKSATAISTAHQIPDTVNAPAQKE